MTTCMGLGTQGLVACLLLAVACFSTVALGVTGAADADPSQRADEVRRGMPMRPDGKSRTQLFFERIARGVQPDLIGTPDRLDPYMQRFRTEALNDPRMIAFNARAQWDAGRGAVVLTGYVEFSEHKESLASYFSVLGFRQIDDRTELMPGAELGDMPFAVVTAESAFLYHEPDVRSETVTQSKRGDTVFLLHEAEDGFYYCHAWDGYVGYVRAAEIGRIDAAGFTAAMPASDSTRADPAIEAGSALRGTPYKWGGTTAAGIDCSGLTRYAYARLGVLLPRDTDQQALVGRLSATRWHRQTMRRGDLMFFLNSRGRINHTAIYLGDNKYLESGGPGVRIGSLDPNDPAYEARRDKGFAFAKRVLE